MVTNCILQYIIGIKNENRFIHREIAFLFKFPTYFYSFMLRIGVLRITGWYARFDAQRLLRIFLHSGIYSCDSLLSEQGPDCCLWFVYVIRMYRDSLKKWGQLEMKNGLERFRKEIFEIRREIQNSLIDSNELIVYHSFFQ